MKERNKKAIENVIALLQDAVQIMNTIDEQDYRQIFEFLQDRKISFSASTAPLWSALSDFLELQKKGGNANA